MPGHKSFLTDAFIPFAIAETSLDENCFVRLLAAEREAWSQWVIDFSVSSDMCNQKALFEKKLEKGPYRT